MQTKFTKNVIKIIQRIPKGRVLTYGRISALAGNPRGARQVSRILHSCTKKYSLPWHRVLNRNGKIAIKNPSGAEMQKELLEKEGIVVESYSVDLDVYLWDVESFSEV